MIDMPLSELRPMAYAQGRRFRVDAPPKRAYRGRRARRQAFYRRQRIARWIERFICTEAAKWQAGIAQAHSDMLVYGTGWFMVGPEALFERTYHGTDEQGRVRVVDTYRQ